ncbi:MAG: porin family protein [Thermonemataceae bacterium]
MRKLLLLVVSMFVFSASQAQLSVGAKLGINVNQLIPSQDDLENDGFQYGVVAGGFARITISKFYLQPEILFSQKGANLQAEGNLSSLGEIERNINSLDVPILIGYKFGQGIFRANLGPVLGFPISASEEGVQGSRYEESVSGANIGYQIGVGLDISKLTIDLRYEGGLSGVGRDNYRIGGTEFKTDDRVSTFQLTVGYKFIGN